MLPCKSLSVRRTERHCRSAFQADSVHQRQHGIYSGLFPSRICHNPPVLPKNRGVANPAGKPIVVLTLDAVFRNSVFRFSSNENVCQVVMVGHGSFVAVMKRDFRIFVWFCKTLLERPDFSYHLRLRFRFRMNFRWK